MSRRSSAGLRSLTLWPSTKMSPSVMSIIRLTIRMAVVLPQPEGPTSTQISPAGTSSERWSTAGFSAPGYRLTTSLNSRGAALCCSWVSVDKLVSPIRKGRPILATARTAPRLLAGAEQTVLGEVRLCNRCRFLTVQIRPCVELLHVLVGRPRLDNLECLGQVRSRLLRDGLAYHK